MHEFDRRGQFDVAVAGIAGQQRHRESQHRAQALAAGIDQMIGNLGYHGDIGPGAGQDRGVYPFHIARDQISEAVNRGRSVTFKRNDDGQQSVSYGMPGPRDNPEKCPIGVRTT